MNDPLQVVPQFRAPNNGLRLGFCPVLFRQKLPDKARRIEDPPPGWLKFRKLQPFRLPMANSRNLGQTAITGVFFEAK